MTASSLHDLEISDTVRIPTRSGIPNPRLAALFGFHAAWAILRNPLDAEIFAALTAAEGLALGFCYDGALRVLSRAERRTRSRSDLVGALVQLTLGRVHANLSECNPDPDDESDIDRAETHLRHARRTLMAIPPGALQGLLLIWATVILAGVRLTRDHDPSAGEALELAHASRVLIEDSFPFKDPDPPSLTTTTTPSPVSRWVTFKRRAYRRLAWTHFYMWAAISTTAVFFHAQAAPEGLDLTRRILDVAAARRGPSWMIFELQFAIGVFLFSQRKYEPALEAYVAARDHFFGGDNKPDSGHSGPSMHYWCALCLSKLGRHAETRAELDHIDLTAAVLSEDCGLTDDEFGNDVLSLARRTYSEMGDFTALLGLCEQFVLILDEKLGPAEPKTIANMQDHAEALMALDRPDDAATVLLEALARVTGQHDDDDADDDDDDDDDGYNLSKRVDLTVRLADALILAGRRDEAGFYLRKRLEEHRALSGYAWKHSTLRVLVLRLMRVYIAGDPEAAHARDAIALYALLQARARMLAPSPNNVLVFFWCRARLVATMDKPDLAIELYERAIGTRIRTLRAIGWDCSKEPPARGSDSDGDEGGQTTTVTTSTTTTEARNGGRQQPDPVPFEGNVGRADVDVDSDDDDDEFEMPLVSTVPVPCPCHSHDSDRALEDLLRELDAMHKRRCRLARGGDTVRQRRSSRRRRQTYARLCRAKHDGPDPHGDDGGLDYTNDDPRFEAAVPGTEECMSAPAFETLPETYAEWRGVRRWDTDWRNETLQLYR